MQTLIRRSGANSQFPAADGQVSRQVSTSVAASASRVVTHQRILAAVWSGAADSRVDYRRIFIRSFLQKLEAPGAVGVIANELSVGYPLLTGG